MTCFLLAALALAAPPAGQVERRVMLMGTALDIAVEAGDRPAALAASPGRHRPAAAERAAAAAVDGLRLEGETAVRERPDLILEEGGWGKGAGLRDALAALAAFPGVAREDGAQLSEPSGEFVSTARSVPPPAALRVGYRFGTSPQ